MFHCYHNRPTRRRKRRVEKGADRRRNISGQCSILCDHFERSDVLQTPIAAAHTNGGDRNAAWCIPSREISRRCEETSFILFRLNETTPSHGASGELRDIKRYRSNHRYFTRYARGTTRYISWFDWHCCVMLSTAATISRVVASDVIKPPPPFL